MAENDCVQCKQSLVNCKNKKPFPLCNGSKENSSKGNDTKTDTNAKHGGIQLDNPCPVHLRMGHKWGKCWANANNKDWANECPKGNESSESHMATIVDDEAIVMAFNDSPMSDNGVFVCECCINEDLLITHHFDDISFAIKQETPSDAFT